MSRCGVASVLALLVISVALSGCLERRTGIVRPRTGFGIEIRAGNDGYSDVDLLLVVDDSQSMQQEQASLAARISDLVRDLTATRPGRPSAESVRIAVTTTNLGFSGEPTTISACQGRGDDGELQIAAAECGVSSPVLEYEVGQDAEAFASTVGCLVRSVGVRGCGLEQQLGAGVRSLERAADHGFPRADAILAVLVLTDEEDCTVAQPREFFPRLPDAADVYCQRVAQGIDGYDPRWLASPEEIVRRLQGDRPDGAFVFAAITGIPPTASGLTPAEILRHPDMRYGEIASTDPTRPGQIVWEPVCRRRAPGSTTDETAAPALRIVEAASHVEGAVVHSICSDDFGPAIDALVHRLITALDGACLTRDLPEPEDGRVQCIVREVMPAGVACSAHPARTPHSVLPDGRQRCEVAQAPGGVGVGWFYSPATADQCSRIGYTEGATPPRGAQLEVDCYFEIPPPDGIDPGPLGGS